MGIQSVYQLDIVQRLFEHDIERICVKQASCVIFVEPRIGRLGDAVIIEMWCWMPSQETEEYWQIRFTDIEDLLYQGDPRIEEQTDQP